MGLYRVVTGMAVVAGVLVVTAMLVAGLLVVAAIVVGLLFVADAEGVGLMVVAGGVREAGRHVVTGYRRVVVVEVVAVSFLGRGVVGMLVATCMLVVAANVLVVTTVVVVVVVNKTGTQSKSMNFTCS